jgi:hypothetical protein
MASRLRDHRSRRAHLHVGISAEIHIQGELITAQRAACCLHHMNPVRASLAQHDRRGAPPPQAVGHRTRFDGELGASPHTAHECVTVS